MTPAVPGLVPTTRPLVPQTVAALARVKPGDRIRITQIVRISKDSAQAAKVLAELGVHLQVTADKAVVRLGGIQARAAPVMASAGAAPATP